jgi:alpha-D-xyloside xylohydrolase
MQNHPLLPYVAFAARPPELPVRGPGDPGLPSYVTRAELAGQGAQSVHLAGTTQDGNTVNLTLEIVAPGIARVLIEGPERDPRRVTLALADARRNVPVTVQVSAGRVALISDGISVHADLDPFHLSFHGPDGHSVLEQDNGTTIVTDLLAVLPCGYSVVDGRRVAFHDSFAAEPDEHFYGFGEKFTDFDKRGQRLEMWNYDAYGAQGEWAYKNVPFFVSSRGYGIFVDSVRRVNFDMAQSNHAAFTLIGPDPKTIISRYADLVSHPIQPPKWSLGLWMSSGFKDDDAQSVMARARALREHDIPCDVLHLDCYWQRYGRWSEMLWDRDMFPDPEGLIREVHALGFRVCLWINSYIGIESERFTEGSEKGYFLKNRAGETYVAPLWGTYHPPVAVVDVTNPEAAAWYREMLRVLLRQGIDVFKTDFGEGVPADAVACNGMTGDELHNLYTLLYNDLAAGVTVEETGGTGLVWGRSTYAGGQRHAAQWGGDPNCTYQALASTLRGGLSMGMCGHAFWSHDIGGFHRQPSPDLYVRWAQFGLFSPMSRAHGMTTRLPWDYGEEAERIFRDYVKLRYRLLPYIYTYSMIAAEQGLPMLRAMVLEFPDDPLVRTLDLQYMFGSELLVAPVYNAGGKRPVYLPAGQWVDFWTRQVLTGPGVANVEAPLDVLPLYVRANALIPTIEPATQIPDGPFENVVFDAYLLPGGRGSFTLRDTDGATTVTATLDNGKLAVAVEGAKKTVSVRLVPLKI